MNLIRINEAVKRMKWAKLLVWLTQLGMSVALPPLGFLLLALWLKNQFSWGNWVIVVSVILGIIVAIDGLRSCIKAMLSMLEKEKDSSPPGFNQHF